MPTKGPTQVIIETVGAGARSQSASWICCVGPSSVMNASDLDRHTFVSEHTCGNQSSCSLPSPVKKFNSENGLPKLRRGAALLTLRHAAIRSIGLLLVLGLPAAALEKVTIRSCYAGDTCRTTDGQRIRLACIDTPEMRGKRAQPEPAKAARDHLRAMVTGRSVDLPERRSWHDDGGEA